MKTVLKTIIFFLSQGFSTFGIYILIGCIWFHYFPNSNYIVKVGLFIVAFIWNCGMIKILTSEDSDDD